MRKKLNAHNWLEIARRDSNPSQTLYRFRSQGNRAINDLILLAEKLPDDTLKDIFNYTNISKLASAILEKNEVGDSTTVDEDAGRRIQLATRLVEIGIETCINQYQSKIEQNSVLNKYVIDELREARDLCNEISFKIRLPRIEEAAKKEDLIYLFNWNKIEEVYEPKVVSDLKGEQTKKFAEFLESKYYDLMSMRGIRSMPLGVINMIHFDRSYTERHVMDFEFTDIDGYRVKGEITLFGQKTPVLYMEIEGETMAQRNFVIRKENDDILMYEKRENMGSNNKFIAQSKK